MASVSALTLGCKVNQYDTQAMLEAFRAHGYEILPYGQKTDVIIINTCTVTNTGDNKSKKAVRHCAAAYPQAAIVVGGCLAQRDARDLALMDGVRVVLGTKKRSNVVELLNEALMNGGTVISAEEPSQGEFEDLRVTSLEGRTRAVLKIQEGCRNRCAYCIIPRVRGPLRSRPIESIRQEVARLRDNGFKEVVLTGIHLNSYGADNDADLGQAIIAALEAGVRIRLGSLEPTLRDEALIASLAGYGNLCPQFHLSLQSGCDAVLARMRRRYNTAMYRSTVALLRRYFPGCAITTDVITGFPGETEAEFAQTEAFVGEIGFAKVHVFPFSQRESTEAALMDGQIPLYERQRRAQAIIHAAERAQAAYLQTKLGTELSVLFEEERDGYTFGYSGCYCRCAAKGSHCGMIRPFVPAEIKGDTLYGDIKGGI